MKCTASPLKHGHLEPIPAARTAALKFGWFAGIIFWLFGFHVPEKKSVFWIVKLFVYWWLPVRKFTLLKAIVPRFSMYMVPGKCKWTGIRLRVVTEWWSRYAEQYTGRFAKRILVYVFNLHTSGLAWLIRRPWILPQSNFFERQVYEVLASQVEFLNVSVGTWTTVKVCSSTD